MSAQPLARALRTGWAFLAAGNPAAADKHARDALSVDPESSEALTLLARSLLDRRDWRAAEEVARYLIKSDPESAGGHHLLGLAVAGRGEGLSALGFFEKALALDETFAPAHHGRALMLDAHGRAKEAETAYLRALELEPDDAAILAHYGDFLAARGRGSEAAALLDRAGELDPSDITFVIAKGHELLRKGDAAGALEQAMQALAESPSNRMAIELLLLARIQSSGLMALWWRLLRRLDRMDLKTQLWSALGAFLVWAVVWQSWGSGQSKPIRFIVLISAIAVPLLMQAGPRIVRFAIDRALRQTRLGHF